MKRPTQVPWRLAAAAITGFAFLVLPCAPALAQVPSPWAVGLQRGFSPVKRDIIDLNHLVLIIIIVITAFVGALLGWVIWRYNARRNPVASPLSHNTPIEIAWTVIPILILVLMAIPSFRLVFYEDRTDHPDLTVKVTGHQWYWEYTYPDLKNLDFSSYIIPDDKLKPGQLRLLAVDNELVLPVGKNIRLLETSGDVIHSFFIPSLGVQRYAIPGRTIETWVRIDQPGVYYGECNQICGTNHSRMPIAIRGVSAEEFQAWVAQAQKQFADAGPTSPQSGGIWLASATEARR
jgi:cytochrome c oxidase subunit II